MMTTETRAFVRLHRGAATAAIALAVAATGAPAAPASAQAPPIVTLTQDQNQDRRVWSPTATVSWTHPTGALFYEVQVRVGNAWVTTEARFFGAGTSRTPAGDEGSGTARARVRCSYHGQREAAGWSAWQEESIALQSGRF